VYREREREREKERTKQMEEVLGPGPNLVYKDLLTSTFTQVSHDRGIKTSKGITGKQDSGDVVTERVLDRDGEGLDTRDGGHTTYE